MKSLTQYIKESSERQYVDVIIRNENNELLVLRRANYMRNFRGMWGVVGGSIESTESAKDAAAREVFEETQIDKFDDLKELKTIDHDDCSLSHLFLMTVSKVSNIKISREHAQYKWISSIDEVKGKWMPQIKDELCKIIGKI